MSTESFTGRAGGVSPPWSGSGEALNPDTASVRSSLGGSSVWLFSAPVDLAVFLGSALFSLFALWIGYWLGILNSDTPDWAWVPAVLLVDVAHVWATAFRVYLDPSEFQRRPLLYTLVPVAGLIIGVALYSQGALVFWRVLAYLAVFHFVRQQYGWVALYRARAGERDRLGRWIDMAAIYLATIYPLIYWHANLPRRFSWFRENDWQVPAGSFLAEYLPIVEQVVRPLYWTALTLYAAHSLYRTVILRRPTPGKDIVVGTTALCWYIGIVWFNSDYAFTVTNVIIHGVPYMALVYWYWRQRLERVPGPRWWQVRSLVPFLATLWLIAYVEEIFWDRGVWHDRSSLFGASWDAGQWLTIVVPLLALPQLTHYILDGFIWRRRTNPEMGALVGR